MSSRRSGLKSSLRNTTKKCYDRSKQDKANSSTSTVARTILSDSNLESLELPLKKPLTSSSYPSRSTNRRKDAVTTSSERSQEAPFVSTPSTSLTTSPVPFPPLISAFRVSSNMQSSVSSPKSPATVLQKKSNSSTRHKATSISNRNSTKRTPINEEEGCSRNSFCENTDQLPIDAEEIKTSVNFGTLSTGSLAITSAHKEPKEQVETKYQEKGSHRKQFSRVQRSVPFGQSNDKQANCRRNRKQIDDTPNEGQENGQILLSKDSEKGSANNSCILISRPCSPDIFHTDSRCLKRLSSLDNAESHIECDQSILDSAKDYLLHRLLDAPVPQTNCHIQAEQALFEICQSGVLNGTSNSLLVVGPRGSGKTTVVNNVIRRLNACGASEKREFVSIHIHGLVHGDDASALKEIASQLMGVSFPESMNDNADVVGSAAEIARALRQALRSGSSSTSQCIIITIDDIDIYAHSGQQTLLYTLLDHIQNAAVPMVLVGMTCRLDFRSLLEKRVLSRFSQRYVHLFNAFSRFEDYLALFTNMFKLPTSFEPNTFQNFWNTKAERLTRNGTVLAELHDMHSQSTSDIRQLQTLAFNAITQTSIERPHVCAEWVYEERHHQTMDATVALLLDLSALELCLIIAMNNLRYRGKTQFNFEKIFESYTTFFKKATQQGGGEFYRKPVALKAFEQLFALELVCPRLHGTLCLQQSSVPDVYTEVHLLVEDRQVLEVIEKYPMLSTRVKLWGRTHGL
eukprot:gene5569-7217_t